MSSLSEGLEGLPNQWKEQENYPHLEAESTVSNEVNDGDTSESSVDCSLGMKEGSLNDVSSPCSQQNKGSSLPILDEMRTIVLDSSSCGSDALIDYMDFGDEIIESEKRDMCEKIDPPGYVFEGSSVVSETGDIIGANTGFEVLARKVDNEKNGNEAKSFILPLQQPYQNQTIINDKSTSVQHNVISKPGSLNHVLDQVIKRNKETYLDFVKKSRCFGDIATSSSCFVKAAKEEDSKHQLEWDLPSSSNESLLSEIEASSKSSKQRRSTVIKDDVASRLSFFGVRRKRNQNKQTFCCEDSNEAELTTAVMERFNNVGSLLVRRSDMSLANLTRCDFRATKERDACTKGDLGISCRNSKNVPIKKFSDVQFNGSESNKSQRALTELKDHEKNIRFFANRMRSIGSESSISSLFTETDVPVILDPLARPSKRMKKACNRVLSDGDVWVEKVLKSKKTGNKRSFFYSVKTGNRRVDEPPTGSCKVIYSSHC